MAGNNVVVGVEPWGGRTRAVVVDHGGPSAYVSGGETLGQSVYGGPNIFGLAGFYMVVSGLSDSATYLVQALYGGTGVRSFVKLKWTVVSTGQEVTNGIDLSGENVRLMVLGG